MTIPRAPVETPLFYGRPDAKVTSPSWLEWFQRIFDDRHKISGLPTYADNAAAVLGGLKTDALYKTATGQVMVVY